MDQGKPWEVGGDFHWLGLPTGPFIPWPQPGSWFGLGEDAVLGVWHMLTSQHPDTQLWVPDYFCPEVTACWRGAGVRMGFFADDPRWPHPDWETLKPSPGDLVLAVNYFGVRSGEVWQAWHREQRRVVLVEDHTHDPLSDWALHSKAEYAFASLRKTSFAPDGALLWSPQERPLPPEPPGGNWSGSALKLAAMVWKTEYLTRASDRPATKATYRSLQVEGERTLLETRDTSISPWSRALLEAGYPESWRHQRERNVRLFLDLVAGQDGIEPLFRAWPTGHCPFNAVLVLRSESEREAVRSGLIAADIYPPIHWRPLPEASDRSRDLSNRILTIPLDQRYRPQDVRKVARLLRDSVLPRIGERSQQRVS